MENHLLNSMIGCTGACGSSTFCQRQHNPGPDAKDCTGVRLGAGLPHQEQMCPANLPHALALARTLCRCPQVFTRGGSVPLNMSSPATLLQVAKWVAGKAEALTELAQHIQGIFGTETISKTAVTSCIFEVAARKSFAAKTGEALSSAEGAPRP